MSAALVAFPSLRLAHPDEVAATPPVVLRQVPPAPELIFRALCRRVYEPYGLWA